MTVVEEMFVMNSNGYWTMMIGGELYNSISKTKLGLSVKADRISSVSIFYVNKYLLLFKENGSSAADIHHIILFLW